MILGISIAIVLVILIYLYIENTWIKTQHISIKIPFMESSMKGTKIVQLTDLHFPNQGVPVSRLIKKVKDETPDMILLTGDVVQGNKSFPDAQVADFCKALVEIAPTFAVTGNHDIANEKLEKWKETLSSAGVKVLLDEAVWFPINHSGLVVMGLAEKEDFEAAPKPILKNVELSSEWEGEVRILLAHHPEFLEEYLMDLTHVPDLIFAGHAHGGQFRLPLIGGLFAPGQGTFPKYTAGVYYDPEMPGKRMIVSRGIGNSTFPFRLNNRPEIIVTELK